MPGGYNNINTFLVRTKKKRMSPSFILFHKEKIKLLFCGTHDNLQTNRDLQKILTKQCKEFYKRRAQAVWKHALGTLCRTKNFSPHDS